MNTPDQCPLPVMVPSMRNRRSTHLSSFLRSFSNNCGATWGQRRFTVDRPASAARPPGRDHLLSVPLSGVTFSDMRCIPKPEDCPFCLFRSSSGPRHRTGSSTDPLFTTLTKMLRLVSFLDPPSTVQHRSLGDLSPPLILPERHQEFPGQRHDPDSPLALPLSEPRPEPLRQLALRLPPHPHP